jgi:E3 ubiquitin-protein ligase RNF14
VLVLQADCECHSFTEHLLFDVFNLRFQASGKLTQTEMAQEILNIRELYKDVRLCPTCRVAINRISGCNKMMCTSCGQLFCFRCCKAISGYSHFK